MLNESSQPAGGVGAAVPHRPYLRVLFECCSIYQRIYRDPNGKSYTGRCPRCLKPIRFKVGEGGTACRDFAVF